MRKIPHLGENLILSSYPSLNSSSSLLLMQEYRPQTVIEKHEGERPEGIDAFKHGTLLKLNQQKFCMVQFQQCHHFQTVQKRQYLLVVLLHDVLSPFNKGLLLQLQCCKSISEGACSYLTIPHHLIFTKQNSLSFLSCRNTDLKR